MSLLKSRFIELIGNIQNPKYQLVELNEICEFIKDGTHQTPIYTEDRVNGFKFLSSKDVTSQKINWSNIKYIPKELHEQLYAKLSPKRGDILLAKNGTTGVAAVVDSDEIFDIYVSLALLRPKSGVNVSYLCSALNSEDLKRQFNSSLKGIGVPNLHLREIKKARIIFPPIDIQNKISSITKQIDKSKFLLQQILEKFELLKKSRFIEMFGNVATNNKRWEKTKLGNKSVIGSSKRIFANEYTTEGIPFYRSKEIIELGMGEKPSVELYISKKRYQEIKEKFGIPIPGDILMTAVGTIGKFWIVPNSKPFYYKDGNLVYIRTKEFNPLFLKKLLEMLIEKYKVENANGSAYTALTIEKLKDLQIVLPPMTLQKQYEEFHIQIDKSKFNVFQDQTAAQVKVIVVLHHIC